MIMYHINYTENSMKFKEQRGYVHNLIQKSSYLEKDKSIAYWWMGFIVLNRASKNYLISACSEIPKVSSSIDNRTNLPGVAPGDG